MRQAYDYWQDQPGNHQKPRTRSSTHCAAPEEKDPPHAGGREAQLSQNVTISATLEPCKPSGRKARPQRLLVGVGAPTQPAASRVDECSSTETTRNQNALRCRQRCNLTDSKAEPLPPAGRHTSMVHPPSQTGGATAALRRHGNGTCGADSRGAQRHPDSTNGTDVSESELTSSQL